MSASTTRAVANKLEFDFKSLITALETYVTNYDGWDSHQRFEAWLNVGKAQRDVPAHVAHEYCRHDRPLDPRPHFGEENLPRHLKFYNYKTDRSESWFPLGVSASSGLGVDFALEWWSLVGNGNTFGGAHGCATSGRGEEVLIIRLLAA